MDGNKVDAYEREELEKKDKYRKNAFQEMVSLFGSSGKDTVHLPEGMAELPVEEADNPLQVPIILSVLLPVPTVT